MFNKGDFHLHTTASDGGLTPYEVVRIASKNGYDVISITDHDTLDSLEEAIKSGEKLGVKIIPGIELSTIHNKETIHILGYFRDDNCYNKEFKSFLQELKDHRVYRGKKIIENLKKYFNIDISYEKISQEAKGVIARPHIANAILEKGYNFTWDYIFNEILSENSPAYVANKKVSTKEGIEILQNLNATVILAHPVLIKNSTIEEMMQLPFDGIEAIYPLNTKKEEKQFKAVAKKFNKLITAGSDFHGLTANDNTHGKLGKICLRGENLNNFLNSLL